MLRALLEDRFALKLRTQNQTVEMNTIGPKSVDSRRWAQL